MVVAHSLEAWDPLMSFESEAEEVNCTSQELDQEENSFYPGCCKAYVGSDVGSDILDPGLSDLNEERFTVSGTVLQALLVSHEDSVALEKMDAKKLKDHRVLLVHHGNT